MVLAAACWGLWLIRNDMVFNNKQENHKSCCSA